MTTKKLYYVFAYSDYYPSGGLRDLRGMVDDPKHIDALADSLDGYDTVEVYTLSPEGIFVELTKGDWTEN